MNDATGHPTDEVLAAFLDGGLSETEREDVITHLSECDECREFVADWACVTVASTGERGMKSGWVGDSSVKVIKAEKEHGGKAPGRIRECPHCHRTLGAEGQYCVYCGMDTSKASITCANCGRKVGSSDAYCSDCGTPLTADGIPASPEKAFIMYENGSLAGGILSFILSFFMHGFFWQFLVAFGAFMGLYVYFRMKREVMMDLVDALRSGDKAKEDEIIRRLRRRFKA